MQVFEPPLDGFNIVLMNAEISLIGKKRVSMEMDLDALQLSTHILRRFTGQVGKSSYAYCIPHFPMHACTR